MFMISSLWKNVREETNNIRDIVDIVFGITGDEEEGKRAARLAGDMKVGETFFSREFNIQCFKEG